MVGPGDFSRVILLLVVSLAITSIVKPELHQSLLLTCPILGAGDNFRPSVLIGSTVSAGSYAGIAGTITSRVDTVISFQERRETPQMREAKPRLDYILVALPVSCIMSNQSIWGQYLVLLLCWC
jgi:hypothetical protein